jgi:8-oxo-dGTP diphosphatase
VQFSLLTILNEHATAIAEHKKYFFIRSLRLSVILTPYYHLLNFIAISFSVNTTLIEIKHGIMYELENRAHYPISVDSVVFGYTEGELKVALIKRNKNPFVGMWAIPGGFMEGTETVEETALRELKEETGITEVYLEQFHVFNKLGRDPRGPTVTVALFALINSDQCHLIASEDAATAKWWPAYKLPPLAFDHDEIYAEALNALRNALRSRSLAFQLLPEEFTLTHLQDLYEQVFHIKLDKRNFRKKVAKMDYIQPTGNKTLGERHRPALLYRYDPKRYSTFLKETFF